jgi:hypothetical protein
MSAPVFILLPARGIIRQPLSVHTPAPDYPASRGYAKARRWQLSANATLRPLAPFCPRVAISLVWAGV